MIRATTACTFSTSEPPKVALTFGVLYILTWKCASRHNGVHFFISHLASLLRTRRFSEPTFRPSGATNHWKNTVFRDFPTFSRICIFFLLTLSLLLFSLLIFLFSHSASALLCFSSVHIVGSLTSKLPSISHTVANLLLSFRGKTLQLFDILSCKDYQSDQSTNISQKHLLTFTNYRGTGDPQLTNKCRQKKGDCRQY